MVPLGFVMLAYAQHHCQSARTATVGYGTLCSLKTAPFFAEVVPTTFYCFLLVSARGATYILLLSYCPAFGFAVMGLMILANFAVLSHKFNLFWGCPDEYNDDFSSADMGYSYTRENHVFTRIIYSFMSLMSPYNQGREMNSLLQNLVSLLCVPD
jgi:hypothetical protein